MNKNLVKIFRDLQKGKEYGYYYAMRYPVFHTVMCKTITGYIYVNTSGSFHIDNTLDELQDLLDNILGLSPEEFLEKYQVYSEKNRREWEEIASAQNTTEYRKWRK